MRAPVVRTDTNWSESCAPQIVAVHEDGPTWRETVYDIMYVDDGKTGTQMTCNNLRF
jgi:hypothetical protein